jgi:hypothetical protein
MDEEMKTGMMKTLAARRDAGALESEADFLCGVMAAYLHLNPESEDDGSWCPPSWWIKIIRGDSVLEAWENAEMKKIEVA